MAANAIGVTAYFTGRVRDVAPQAITTTSTPSWRVETGWEPTHEARAATPLAEVESAAEAAPLDRAAELVTSAQLREANRSPCPHAVGASVDVRRFGARGDGRTNDTAAIQKANNAVAERGGGRVVFPNGVYRAAGIKQDSCVEFFGTKEATILHPPGDLSSSIVESRTRSTTGSIARNSRVLKVKSTAGMRPGVVLAIQAAGGRSRVQRTKLASSLSPYVTTVTVQNPTGLQRGWRNYLFVENELISYDGISGNTLLDVERGLFGTPQVHHGAGSVVAQAARTYAVVVRVSGNRVTLDRLSTMRLENVDVDSGSVGVSMVGLTLDGNRGAQGTPDTNPVALSYSIARFAAVRAATLRRGDHGGIRFDQGTRDSVIEGNTLTDNGDASDEMGSAIWLFRGASNNVVRGNTISGNTFIGVTVDDRTVHSTEYDAESNGNTIEDNAIDLPTFIPTRNSGVLIIGSSGTRVTKNVISNARTGVMVARSTQGPIASIAHQNGVRNNILVGHKVGINVSGSDNDFVGNEIRQAGQPWRNSGERNRFVDNTVE